MASKRAGALCVGDIVRHDPSYGTHAKVVARCAAPNRSDVTVSFHNSYECAVYTTTLDRLRMFEVEEKE